MKKIFLDTNFLLDYLVRPEYAEAATQVLRGGSKKGYRFVVSFLTVANFAYINRKMPAELRNKMIEGIVESFEVAPNTSYHLSGAARLNTTDYEDAIQYLTAVSSGCEAIITRNTKDFTFSKLPIYTPAEFLEKSLMGL